MNPDFWQAKWRANEIGFHQAEIHPLLCAHWPALPPSRVLVPLCGKSRDLIWLRERGHVVVGVELSEIAVAAFFAEHRMKPVISAVGEFTCYHADDITLYCGDFFAATPALCGVLDAIYDRAALIALMPEQRDRYLATVRKLLAERARGLLITVEYPEGLVAAPPFSITNAEVMRRFGGWSAITEIIRQSSDVKGKAAIEVAYGFVLNPPGATAN